MNMLCVIMGSVQALEVIPEETFHKLLCDLHCRFRSYFLLSERYDKVVALPLIQLSILPLCGKHLLKGGSGVAGVASHQCAILRLFSFCNVGNGVCKMHHHVSCSCLVDAGEFGDCY